MSVAVGERASRVNIPSGHFLRVHNPPVATNSEKGGGTEWTPIRVIALPIMFRRSCHYLDRPQVIAQVGIG
jgi:hypothetical protein